MNNARHPAKWIGAMALCLLAAAPRARADIPVFPVNPTMSDKPNPQPAIVVALEKATEGLLMPSETDAPFKIVFVAREIEKSAAVAEKPATNGDGKPNAETQTEAKREAQPALSIQALAKLAGAPEDAKIETRDLDEFFAVATTVEDWMNEDEKSTAARFSALLDILKTQLKGAQVLVWGDAEKQVAIIGEAEGAMAGVTTLIVET